MEAAGGPKILLGPSVELCRYTEHYKSRGYCRTLLIKSTGTCFGDQCRCSWNDVLIQSGQARAQLLASLILLYPAVPVSIKLNLVINMTVNVTPRGT